MDKNDKKELLVLIKQTENVKYGTYGALTCLCISIPFLFLVLVETNLIYQLISGSLGWSIGYYYSKYVKE